jgi:SAM-dependent methyltransferase
MKALDRLLQRWRIAKAGDWIPAGARVLDVGCDDGALFRQLRLTAGLGLDPKLKGDTATGEVPLVAGAFPDALPAEAGPFDVITCLAVLEHVPRERQAEFACACWDALRDGGLLLVTVPSPRVDWMLKWLRALRLVAGMSLEEHFGFEPRETPALFARPGFVLSRHRRFQLGLNNLFVFRKTSGALRPPQESS